VVNKQAYCWGDNTNGELGNAGALAYTSARVVVTAAGAPLTNVTAVSSGYSHACAVANKQAYCWGTNGGELGDNTTTNRTGAVAVQTATGTLTGVTAISAGTNLSCAIANKQAYCWGNNFYGGVGDGTNVDKLVATLVVNATAPLTKVTAIAAGYGHACAVANKIVYCWGVNGVGQIGNNSLVNVALATEVQLDGGLLLNKATDVGVGDENSCAINNKQVYCWGVNGSGQVGDGTTTNRRVATRVMVDATTPLGAATQLGVGGYHACALVSKQVYCWGDNGDGQLGDGNSGTQSVYAVAAKYLASDVQLTGVTQVKAGYYHTCAVIAKQVWCWGANGSNQLGDDTSTDRKGAVKSLFHRILLTQLKGL
jgi:alpha-tubulin suppressor-like RCC1 family protein